MCEHQLAAVMIYSMILIWPVAFLFSGDTNPFNGKPFRNLSVRFYDWLCKVIPE